MSKAVEYEQYGARIERSSEVGQKFNAVLRAAKAGWISGSSTPVAGGRNGSPLPARASYTSRTPRAAAAALGPPPAAPDAHEQLSSLQRRLAKLTSHVDSTLSRHVRQACATPEPQSQPMTRAEMNTSPVRFSTHIDAGSSPLVVNYTSPRLVTAWEENASLRAELLRQRKEADEAAVELVRVRERLASAVESRGAVEAARRRQEEEMAVLADSEAQQKARADALRAELEEEGARVRTAEEGAAELVQMRASYEELRGKYEAMRTALEEVRAGDGAMRERLDALQRENDDMRREHEAARAREAEERDARARAAKARYEAQVSRGTSAPAVRSASPVRLPDPRSVSPRRQSPVRREGSQGARPSPDVLRSQSTAASDTVWQQRSPAALPAAGDGVVPVQPPQFAASARRPPSPGRSPVSVANSAAAGTPTHPPPGARGAGQAPHSSGGRRSARPKRVAGVRRGQQPLPLPSPSPNSAPLSTQGGHPLLPGHGQVLFPGGFSDGDNDSDETDLNADDTVSPVYPLMRVGAGEDSQVVHPQRSPVGRVSAESPGEPGMVLSGTPPPPNMSRFPFFDLVAVQPSPVAPVQRAAAFIPTSVAVEAEPARTAPRLQQARRAAAERRQMQRDTVADAAAASPTPAAVAAQSVRQPAVGQAHVVPFTSSAARQAVAAFASPPPRSPPSAAAAAVTLPRSFTPTRGAVPVLVPPSPAPAVPPQKSLVTTDALYSDSDADSTDIENVWWNLSNAEQARRQQTKTDTRPSRGGQRDSMRPTRGSEADEARMSTSPARTGPPAVETREMGSGPDRVVAVARDRGTGRPRAHVMSTSAPAQAVRAGREEEPTIDLTVQCVAVPESPPAARTRGRATPPPTGDDDDDVINLCASDGGSGSIQLVVDVDEGSSASRGRAAATPHGARAKGAAHPPARSDAMSASVASSDASDAASTGGGLLSDDGSTGTARPEAPPHAAAVARTNPLENQVAADAAQTAAAALREQLAREEAERKRRWDEEDARRRREAEAEARRRRTDDLARRRKAEAEEAAWKKRRAEEEAAMLRKVEAEAAARLAKMEREQQAKMAAEERERAARRRAREREEEERAAAEAQRRREDEERRQKEEEERREEEEQLRRQQQQELDAAAAQQREELQRMKDELRLQQEALREIDDAKKAAEAAVDTAHAAQPTTDGGSAGSTATGGDANAAEGDRTTDHSSVASSHSSARTEGTPTLAAAAAAAAPRPPSTAGSQEPQGATADGAEVSSVASSALDDAAHTSPAETPTAAAAGQPQTTAANGDAGVAPVSGPKALMNKMLGSPVARPSPTAAASTPLAATLLRVAASPRGKPDAALPRQASLQSVAGRGAAGRGRGRVGSPAASVSDAGGAGASTPKGVLASVLRREGSGPLSPPLPARSASGRGRGSPGTPKAKPQEPQAQPPGSLAARTASPLRPPRPAASAALKPSTAGRGSSTTHSPRSAISGAGAPTPMSLPAALSSPTQVTAAGRGNARTGSPRVPLPTPTAAAKGAATPSQLLRSLTRPASGSPEVQTGGAAALLSSVRSAGGSPARSQAPVGRGVSLPSRAATPRGGRGRGTSPAVQPSPSPVAAGRKGPVPQVATRGEAAPSTQSHPIPPPPLGAGRGSASPAVSSQATPRGAIRAQPVRNGTGSPAMEAKAAGRDGPRPPSVVRVLDSARLGPTRSPPAAPAPAALRGIAKVPAAAGRGGRGAGSPPPGVRSPPTR